MEEGSTMKVAQCCRGHQLKVPYAFFTRIQFVGPEQPNSNEFAEYADWDCVRSDGRPKPEGNYMCAGCMLELLMVMDKWREGDPELTALVEKWKSASDGSDLTKHHDL